MIKLLIFLMKSFIRVLTWVGGLTLGIAMGPGVLFFMYLYEPQKPLPEIIIGLPQDSVEASQVMQGRIEKILLPDANIKDIESYLAETGFDVDEAANFAIYKRRQLNCVEHYSIIWTERRHRLQEAAAIVEKPCPGIFED